MSLGGLGGDTSWGGGGWLGGLGTHGAATYFDVLYLYPLLLQGLLSSCMLKNLDPFKMQGTCRTTVFIHCIYTVYGHALFLQIFISLAYICTSFSFSFCNFFGGPMN